LLILPQHCTARICACEEKEEEDEESSSSRAAHVQTPPLQQLAQTSVAEEVNTGIDAGAAAASGTVTASAGASTAAGWTNAGP
jgi:hypothetical protein